jgi:hypothetical protein
VFIDFGLFGDIPSLKSFSKDCVDVVDGSENTFSHEVFFFAVSKFEGFIFPSGGSGWDSSSEEPLFSNDICLNSGVSSGVIYLSGLNGLDGGSVEEAFIEKIFHHLNKIFLVANLKYEYYIAKFTNILFIAVLT